MEEANYLICFINKKQMITNFTESNLPSDIPIFPLPGAVVFPFGTLPLNIFEPRYIAMIESVLGSHRMIGMIQPIPGENKRSKDLYPVGCAGKIVSFTETNDSRFLIELAGISRFKLKKELELSNGFRRIIPDWRPFYKDLQNNYDLLDLNELLLELKKYFEKNNINVDLDEITKISNEQILSSIPQICAFKVVEKQAILEAASIEDRVATLISLLRMQSLEGNENENETIN
ncbi:MAG: Lon protease [Alphaproteobacteria bacterium MarineAlpha9_Bin4]|nr:peptidase S16 [Pelagibacterales bacterium]PPR26820.1 MAG: Lon protease [Alphaproteobacteria bacterium MarineAlpha9_Bin4]